LDFMNPDVVVLGGFPAGPSHDDVTVVAYVE
jgi:hypothetical protein